MIGFESTLLIVVSSTVSLDGNTVAFSAGGLHFLRPHTHTHTHTG